MIMTVIQEGAVNTSALLVPDVYIQILSPRHSLLNGVPTNILGIVGSAGWGPKNSPVTISSVADFTKWFGSVQEQPNDLGTAVSIAVLNGANNMRCVRVTDGTDTAASVSVVDVETPGNEGMLVSGKYTGSEGNGFTVDMARGTKANSWKVTISRPNFPPEIFDNITGTNLELWQNIASAINNGQSGVRSKSEFVTATPGSTPSLPKEDLYTMSGGTDGNTTITTTQLIGNDTSPRTGMYALRNTNCSVAFIHGLTDKLTWTNQVNFGLSEGVYMLLTGPAGEYTNISTAVAEKQNAGVDSYAAKVLLGDWCYYNDITNGKLRLVSAQAYVGGRLVNLIPAQSALNQQIYGIVATQSTDANKVYSHAELEELVIGGIDVVTNPSPGGDYFSARIGHNSSSNNVIWGDNYTRMTNYIAYTLNSGLGIYVGATITEDTWASASATLTSFLQAMASATPPLIGDPSGNIPYSVQIDEANNPPDVVAKGMMVAAVKVRYLAVVEVFLINLEGGQSVIVGRTTQPA